MTTYQSCTGEWFVKGDGSDDRVIGPYRTRAEADDDRRGLERFDKYSQQPGYVTTDPGEPREPVYQLEKQPAKSQPVARFESTKTRPRTLFSGLDCLPGQEDLFDC